MRATGEIFLQIVGNLLKNELHFQEFPFDFAALFESVAVWAAPLQVFAIPVCLIKNQARPKVIEFYSNEKFLLCHSSDRRWSWLPLKCAINVKCNWNLWQSILSKSKNR